MRRVLSLVFSLALAAGAAALLTGGSASGDSKHYRIELDNAFGLVPGGDFKIGGVRAGETTGFGLSRGYPAKALVDVEVTEPGFSDLRADATCRVRPQSLIGEYFLDCDSGQSPKRLPDGGTIPVEQTEGTVNQDLINNVLRRPYRERLRLIISDLGAGLAGNPQNLQEVLRRAHPGLRETSKVLRILGDQDRTLQAFITNSDRVIGELAARKDDVVNWVDATTRTAQVSASRSAEIAETFKRFPAFLDELRPTMAKLRDVADEQVPLLTDLRQAGPAFNAFVRELRPFAQASRPALRSLGETSLGGMDALQESRNEIAELARAAVNAPALAKPLRQFLQTMDDRDRSFEADPTMEALAPPPPDPTAYHDGQGSTGFEGLLSFFYYGANATSTFDEVSHMLRVVQSQATECGHYRTGSDYAENKGLYERCNAWYGPYQPGITDPDPTEGGPAAVAAAYARDRDPRAHSGPRGAGDPEAPPTPGKPDISKPQIVLPPAVGRLLDVLPQLGKRPNLSQPPQLEDQDLSPLLDFLLSP
jgi:phospholipid/cholesterol/gamma-HCH transport system substrate-binding protein